jgi:inner membrane protein
MLAPGVFLIWLGIAALLTGVVDWLFAPSWQVAALIFAALSVVAVLLGRSLYRGGDLHEGSPMLNRRAEALVGRVVTLDAPIVGGEGRVRVDDSSWRATGPDMPAGARMRVSRIDGTTLVVEPA